MGNRAFNLSKFMRRYGTAFIYTLSDSRTGDIRYVGCTNNPAQRERSHWYSSSSTPIGRWIGELKAAGAHPVFTIVAETTRINRESEERAFINQCTKLGDNLLNRKPGRSKSGFVSTL